MTDRLGWSSCPAPLLLDAMSLLSPAAAGNQGQNPTMSPLGQGRPFCPAAPKGIVLRASTLTPRTRDTSGCALLAPLGFLLLGNATLAFAQTSDTPGVPGSFKVASVAHGSPRCVGMRVPGEGSSLGKTTLCSALMLPFPSAPPPAFPVFVTSPTILLQTPSFQIKPP